MSDASISSGTFSGSGAIADRISAGGPPRKTVAGRLCPRAFGDGVVIAAALADLPVHARAARVVDLHPVHAEVVPRAIGMRRVDERQRDERTAVLGPARERRQAIEPDVGRHPIDHRSALDAPRADLEQLAADVARVPHLARCRRQQRLGELDEPANQPQRPLAKRHLGAAGGAEEIRDEPEVGAFDVGEEQRRTARRNHTAVNLRRFEMRIDLRFDRDKVVVTAKLVEERARSGTTEWIQCRLTYTLPTSLPCRRALGP